MLFNSWQYAVFLPLVLLLYWALPRRYRWVLLLCASYYFYMSWNAKLVVLIATTTLTSYVAARGIAAAKSARAKKIWLASACGISLGMLFFFKYFNFFSHSVTALLRAVSLPVSDFTLRLMLPVGISFYTFQTLSYVVDVYRGTLLPEKHLGIYALYVSFFPQLVAGPIERAVNLLPQFREEHHPDAGEWAWGLRMIVFGLFKKVVLADYLAQFVNLVYNDVQGKTPMMYLLTTVMFTLQVYCDFSGYSDVALGSARLLGFRLMENFNTPYFATSIRDFWGRWHISLSSFLRDYIYIPLGGSRRGAVRTCINLLLTFLASGLWHGAMWTYVLWGCLHGVYQITGRLTEPGRARLRGRLHIDPAAHWYRAWQMLFTFGLVCVALVLFRANSLPDALLIFSRLPGAVIHPVQNLVGACGVLGITAGAAVRILISVGALFLYDVVRFRSGDPFLLLQQKKAPLRVLVSYGLALCVLLAAFTTPEGAAVEFIYFQF
ncbi:MAG: MBOAT family O-acyltransferase [Ruthenibacterium sp.]